MAKSTNRETAESNPFAGESLEARKKRARKIAKTLKEAHPDATIALKFEGPFQLLVATILSAQCTDERVNQVTPKLFERFSTPEAFAEADLEAIETLIRSTGFFRQKAKSIKNCSQALVEKHGSAVPESMEELTALPGVGRKTANVIRSNAMGKPGIVVDTHFKRLANRMGLTNESDPVKIEYDLMELLPGKAWSDFSHSMIWHGRRICLARKPKCGECPVQPDCAYGVQQREGETQ